MVFTPMPDNHLCKSLAINSCPLSQGMCSGMPRAIMAFDAGFSRSEVNRLYANKALAKAWAIVKQDLAGGYLACLRGLAKIC